MSADREQNATQLLQQLVEGHASAAERLMPLVYEDLRGLAAGYFRMQKRDHTLQPTALVHEAYVKLIQSPGGWKSRAHFCAVAATAMRQILIDHARMKRSQKRGGGSDRVTLSNLMTPSDDGEVDVITLDELLTELSKLDARQYRIVELRFFGGLTEEEVAEAISVSRTTVQTEWRIAKAWLGKELKKAAGA